MSRSARCAVLLAVLVFHGLTLVFLARNTAKRIATQVEDIVSTQIFMPDPRPQTVPEETTKAQAPTQEPQSARTPAPPRAESGPITVEPLADEPLPWVDWQASAERAAQSVTQPSPYRRFGRPELPHGPVRSPSRGRPVGEVYRDDATGQLIRWLNEDCYQVLATATAGVPVAGAGKQPARVMCSLKSKKPRGDLFKDLPAYKRHLLPESRQR